MGHARFIAGVILIITTVYRCVDSWSHENQTAWGDQYPLCSDSKQSPINIKPKMAEDMHEPGLHWTSNGTSFEGVLVKDTGHGFSVSAYVSIWGPTYFGDQLLSKGGLKGAYKLAQFHYHWGHYGNGHDGSEHRLDGDQKAGELHFVHFHTNFDNLTHALQSGQHDAVAVVGVFIERSYEEPKGFELKLINALKQIAEQNRTEVTQYWSDISLNDLLPDDTLHFYRYEGSLTTPPCNEQVIWTVLKEPTMMSGKLLDQFTHLEDKSGNRLLYTARHVQPLEGRQLHFNQKKKPVTAGNSALSSSVLTVGVLLLALAMALL